MFVGWPLPMDHHQREQRRAAAEAFNQSLEQLAACFQEDPSATDFLAPVPLPEGENQGENPPAEAVLPAEDSPSQPCDQASHNQVPQSPKP
jgi:hypothetical protein